MPSFHVTDNIANDIMYDAFLGVCKYNPSKIVYHFFKWFSLLIPYIACNFIDQLLSPNYNEMSSSNLQLLIKQHNDTHQGLFKEYLKPSIYIKKVRTGGCTPIVQAKWKISLKLIFHSV